MIRVMIVDDQEMIRAGLRTFIEANPELTVVADTGDGFEAIAWLDTNPADVVLMDIRMPGIDGVETTRRIRSKFAADQIRIVILTTFDDDENVFRALRAGANGFLSKGVGPAELSTGILEVAAGGGALSAAAAAALIDRMASDLDVTPESDIAERFELLTPRERDVVALIVSGFDNAQIAEQMFVSPFTVKTHAHRAMAKVAASDRAQLVSLAVRAGIRPA